MKILLLILIVTQWSFASTKLVGNFKGGDLYIEGPIYEDFGWNFFLLTTANKKIHIWTSVRPPELILSSKESPFLVWKDNLIRPYGSVFFVGFIEENQMKLIFQSPYSPSLLLKGRFTVISATSNSIKFTWSVEAESEVKKIEFHQELTSRSPQIRQNIYNLIDDPSYGGPKDILSK